MSYRLDLHVIILERRESWRASNRYVGPRPKMHATDRTIVTRRRLNFLAAILSYGKVSRVMRTVVTSEFYLPLHPRTHDLTGNQYDSTRLSCQNYNEARTKNDDQRLRTFMQLYILIRVTAKRWSLNRNFFRSANIASTVVKYPKLKARCVKHEFRYTYLKFEIWNITEAWHICWKLINT